MYITTEKGESFVSAVKMVGSVSPDLQLLQKQKWTLVSSIMVMLLRLNRTRHFSALSKFVCTYFSFRMFQIRRLLNFTVPRVVAVSPQMRLVEDNPCSISLLDIYKQICSKNGVEHDGPIARYYERLAAVQSRGSQASHQVLRDILKEVQSSMVPRDMMKKWALRTFPSATDYWTFRKMFTMQLALAGFAEFVLHLSRLNPDMIYVHQDSGLLNCSYFRFDIEDATGDLEVNRPVPFRLTPNITEFLTTTGVSGPLTAAMIAMARCLVQPNYKVTSLLYCEMLCLL